jgi:hypothetical protein
MYTLLSARRWSSWPSSVVTLGSRVAWTPGMRLSAVHYGVADAVVAVDHPPAPAVESVQGILGERCAGLLVGLIALYDPHRPRNALAIWHDVATMYTVHAWPRRTLNDLHNDNVCVRL